MTTTDELALTLLAMLDGSRKSLSRDGALMPTLIVESPGDVNVIGLADWDSENKRALMYALGRTHGREAEAIFFFCDAWTVGVEPGEAERRLREGGPPVREMPGREECLIAIAMTPTGQSVVVQQVYTREDDAIIYQEPKRSDDELAKTLQRVFVLEPFWRGAAIWRR